MESPEEKNKRMRTIGTYSGLGFQLAASIVVMLFLGKEADEYFETKPIFTLLLGLFGGFAGMYNLIKTVTNFEKKNNDKKST